MDSESDDTAVRVRRVRLMMSPASESPTRRLSKPERSAGARVIMMIIMIIMMITA